MEGTVARNPRAVSLRNVYLWSVSIVGVILVFWGVRQLPGQQSLLIFLLLVLLAVVAQLSATSLIGGNVTVEVGTAVSMAAIALFTPAAGAIVAAASVTTVTLLNLREHWKGWRGAAEHICFNIGMSAIAIFLAGLVLRGVLTLLSGNVWVAISAGWVMAAIVYDQVNLWTLIALLHLQSGVNPLHIWREHRWAIPINVLVMGGGGGVLAFAIQQFNFIGIAIFFLPIILSAYSFRLYVEQTKKQMENLEDLVADRTGALAQTNTELERANEELAALGKEKDAFLAVLTHDMRTPLTSIKGYASILRDRPLERAQQEHIARIIMRGQDTLLEIVNNILEIEKLQSGTPLLMERTTFDIAILSHTVAESLLALAREKQITLSYGDDIPDPIMVEGDRKKIKRVITNLVSNAIKYTPDGGKVTVRTWLNGRHVYVGVRDNGYGIPAAELPYIFDRYSRVKGHRSLAVGTGLGLAIVKSLVDAHGGDILVESEVDVGSTFTLKLPANTPIPLQ